jgi:HPt (histidine-containing phosphotransfer) domain-containing protein
VPELPALDEAVLARLIADTGDDTEFVRELIDTFTESAPPLLAELQSALAAGDAVTVHRAAHTLKSSAASLGALRLADEAAGIEVAAKGGELPPEAASADLARTVHEALEVLRAVELEEVTR